MNPRALLLPVLFVAFACSSSSGGAAATDAGHDASGSDAADAASPTGDAASDAPQACNALVNGAPTVTFEQVASDPPAPQGGTVVDGTYWLTAVAIYTGPNGPAGASGSGQTTLEVHGGTIQVASSGQPGTRTVTFTTSGTAIDSVDTCPDTDTRSDTYTATPTTIVVELDGGTDDAGARTLVETFTKQ